MAMTINTNVVSINAQRNLSLSGGSLSTTMQRLSSGLRVNSAKDDAAGLAIAERMNAQSKGLAVAARNANDGISLAQTTEGALGKVGDMLQRMRELAVQSSNATNSTADREALQSEVSQLRAEIDRVAKTTSFNGTKVLDGSFTGGVFQVGSQAGDNITIAGTTKATADGLGNVEYGSSTSKSLTAENITNFDKELSGLSIKVGSGELLNLDTIPAATSGTARLGQVVAAINEKTADTGVTAFLSESDEAGKYTISVKSEKGEVVQFVGFDSLNTAAGGAMPAVTSKMVLSAAGDVKTEMDKVKTDGSTPIADAGNLVTKLEEQLAKAAGYDAAGAHTGVAKELNASIVALEATMKTGSTAFKTTAVDGVDGVAVFEKEAAALKAKFAELEKADAQELYTKNQGDLAKASVAALSLTKESTLGDVNQAIDTLNAARTKAGLGNLTTQKATANATDAAAEAASVKVAFEALQAEIDPIGLNVAAAEIEKHQGISKMDISTQAGAWDAIKQIDSAIDQVNAARADLGALQTRFEKAIENIDIQNENITAAKGRIVDADFATETANLSRAQILQQAGTAMVAQANQLPQGVLSLLQ